MVEDDRKRYVITRIGNAIFDRVEEDILSGNMSEDEGMWVYKLARHQWRFDDLSRYVINLDTVKDSPMSDRLCLFREKGKTIPQEVLAQACEAYASAAGLATIVKDKLTIQTVVGTLDPAVLFGQMEAYKDTHFLLCFEHSDSVVLPDDVQPYKVQDVPVAVFLIGDFSANEKLKNSYSGAWHFFHERMKPKLIKLWKGNANDISAFAKDISEGEECGTLQKMMPEGSCMILLLENQDMIAIDPFGMEKEYDTWGCSYGESAEEVDTNGHTEPIPDPVEETPNFFGKPAESAKPVEDKIAADGTKTAKELVEKQFPGVPLAALRNPKHGFVTVQPLMERAPEGNKPQVQKWYKDRLDYIPSNWGDRPLIPAKRQDSVKLGDLGNSTAVGTVLTGKDTAAKHIGAQEPGLKFTEDQKKNAKELTTKIFGNNTEIIADPRKMFDAEKDSPSVAAELGLEGLNSFRLPLKARYHVAKEDPVLAMRIWGDFQRKCYDQELLITEKDKKIEALEKELKEALEAATKPAEAPLVKSAESKPEAGTGKTPQFFAAKRR